MTLRHVRVAFATIALSASAALAQDVPPTAWGRAPDANGALSHAAAAWLGAWSPLRPIREEPRGLLRAPLAPGLLDAPPPRAGAFFLSGAPGALNRDVIRANGNGADTSRFGELRVKSAGVDGAFRRPLDPASVGALGVSGQGWAPVRLGIAIGRFAVDQEQLEPSGFASRVAPYAASPFVSTDSVTPPMRRMRARIEGALGMRFGEFGVGIAAGLESREHTTIDFPIRRAGRSALPAASLGVERGLPWFGARIGAYHRWSEPTETDVLNPAPEPTVYYPIRGYDEPSAVEVSLAAVFSRIDSHATATGGTLEFEALATRVVVTHERGSRREVGYFALALDHPTNRWRAGGSETRVQAQRAIGSQLVLTVVGAAESLSGDAQRLDLTGIAYSASHSRRSIEGDLRGHRGPWQAAATGGAITSERIGTDFVAQLATKLDFIQPFVSGEAARQFARGSVAAGASFAASAATGNIPAALDAGENYRRLVAPALAYDAADTRATAFWITGLFRAGQSTLIATLRSERASSPTDVPHRLQPTGSRTGWTAAFGVRY